MSELNARFWRKAEMVVEPYAGAVIDECLREAIVLALRGNITVRFDFNGRHHILSPETILQVVAKLA